MSKENFDKDNKISLYKQLIDFVEKHIKGEVKNIIWSCEQYREAKKNIDKHEAFFDIEDYADKLETKLIFLCNGTKNLDGIKDLELPKDVVDYQYIEKKRGSDENRS